VLGRSISITLTTAVLILVSFATDAVPIYTIADLGVSGRAKDVNNHGQVVGYFEHQLDCCNTTISGFVWSSSTGIQLLPEFEPRRRYLANAINDNGIIVGASSNPPLGNIALLWENGTVSGLGAGTAVDINNNDEVLFHDAKLFSNGSTTTLSGLDVAYQINNVGQVIGDVTGTDSHDFLWDNGSISVIGDPSWQDSSAAAINDSSQIVGSYFSEDIFGVHAFSIVNGVWTDLGRGFAKALNNSGEIIGRSPQLRPVYFDPELGALLLQDLVVDMGDFSSLTDVHSINDQGQITGYGRINQGSEYHVFLLTPVPIPPECAEIWPEDTVETIGGGQSSTNNVKISHLITGIIVGGAEAYGPKDSRIRICKGTNVTIEISDSTGTPAVTELSQGIGCGAGGCSVISLYVKQKYKAQSNDGTDTDRITLVPQ
jgi:hypothetical protein